MTDGFFEKLLVEYGDSPKSLDWSRDGQRERFEILHEIGIGPKDSVLDVGCGLGHFLDFLVDRDWAGKYTGVDVSGPMIDKARDLHSGDPLSTFEVADAFKVTLPRSDWVVSSGMLNVAVNDRSWMLMKACFAACRKGVAVNMLSLAAKPRRSDRMYFDPTYVFSNASNLTGRLTLRHDYRDNDFTIYLYRKDAA